MLKIGLVGTGNVGSLLAHRLTGIQWIKTRNSDSITSPELTPVDLVILAVPDQQISIASRQLVDVIPATTWIVHTSGVISWEQIDPYFLHRGVLYPLMTISKQVPLQVIDFPWLVDGNSPEFINSLVTECADWALSARVMQTSEREKLHLAAVFANNFTNHLYHLSKRWTADNQLDFELLLPLIQETVLRLATTDPSAVQTGPARRGDLGTIHRHLQLLLTRPEMRFVYEVLTASLLKEYHAIAEDH